MIRSSADRRRRVVPRSDRRARHVVAVGSLRPLAAEAMALGQPVDRLAYRRVAGRCRRGPQRVLVPPGDATALAIAMVELARQRARRRTGRPDVAQRAWLFTLECMIARHEEFYEQLAAGEASRTSRPGRNGHRGRPRRWAAVIQPSRFDKSRGPLRRAITKGPKHDDPQQQHARLVERFNFFMAHRRPMACTFSGIMLVVIAVTFLGRQSYTSEAKLFVRWAWKASRWTHRPAANEQVVDGPGIARVRDRLGLRAAREPHRSGQRRRGRRPGQFSIAAPAFRSPDGEFVRVAEVLRTLQRRRSRPSSTSRITSRSSRRRSLHIINVHVTTLAVRSWPATSSRGSSIRPATPISRSIAPTVRTRFWRRQTGPIARQGGATSRPSSAT